MASALPVTFFGMYSPFAIRLMLRSPAQSGRVSGAVYGISTIGSIAGTLGTHLFLLPSMGSRTLTLSLGAIGVAAAPALFALPWLTRRRAAVTGFAATALLLCFAADARAQALVDDAARAALLKRPDGQIARIETEFNDIFITKRRNEITMSFQLKGWDYTKSVTDLRDPDALPVHYTRFMPLGARLSGDAVEGADDRPRRRLDLDLSRPRHAGPHDRHGGDRRRRDQRGQALFRHPGNAQGEVHLRRRSRVPQPQQATRPI